MGMADASIGFGRSERWKLPVDAAKTWTRIGPRAVEPLEDLSAAVAAAVDAPLGFPPLRQAVIPGDRVAIAVGPDIPQRGPILAGLIQSLVDAHVRPDDITIVYPASDPPVSERDQAATSRARHVVHNPHDRQGLCYLAATAASRALYFPRALTDADVVIPVGCRGALEGPRASVVSHPLFPSLSESETQERVEQALHGDEAGWECEQEMEEAVWLLGVQLAVEVVRGAGGAVVQVVAGTPAAVREQSCESAGSIWRAEVASRPAAMIGSVCRSDRETTWHDVARALEWLLPTVDPEGAVVLLTDLKTSPQSPLREVPDQAPRKTEAASLRAGGESRCAQLVSRMPDSFRIYLASLVPPQEIEEAGWAPVGSETELHRLMRQFPGGLVVDEADRLVFGVSGVARRTV